MKTTVEISDTLVHKAEALASRNRTSLDALVEQGLRIVLKEEPQGREIFRLRRASFRGQGLQPDARGGAWEQLREIVYEGRGS